MPKVSLYGHKLFCCNMDIQTVTKQTHRQAYDMLYHLPLQFREQYVVT